MMVVDERKHLKWKYAMIRWTKGTLQRKEWKVGKGVKASLFLHIKSVYITNTLYHYHILCELKSNKMSKMLSESNSGGAARSWVLVSAILVFWRFRQHHLLGKTYGSNPVRMDSHWNEEVTSSLITEECDMLVWFLVTFCIDTLRIPKEVQKNLICDWTPERQGLLGSQLGLQGVLDMTTERQPFGVDVSPLEKTRDFPASHLSFQGGDIKVTGTVIHWSPGSRIFWQHKSSQSIPTSQHPHKPPP